MDDRSTDIFGPVEENHYDSVKDEEKTEEEQGKEEVSSIREKIFEEEREVEDDKPHYI